MMSRLVSLMDSIRRSTLQPIVEPPIRARSTVTASPPTSAL